MNNQVDIWKADEEILEIFALRVKEKRLKNKLSQTALAKETGISVRTIRNIENANSFNFMNFIKLVRFFSELDKLDGVFKIEDLTPEEQFMARHSEKN